MSTSHPLRDFLSARIAEDRAIATAMAPNTRALRGDRPPGAATPEKILTECEAKDLVVQALDTYVYECDREPQHAEAAVFVRDRVLWHMTLPYRGHSDFDERWKP